MKPILLGDATIMIRFGLAIAAIDDLLDQLTDGEYSAANGQFGVGA